MLGDKLIALKIISQAQLDEALKEQKETGQRLGEVLVAKGFATNEQIENALK